MEGRKTISLVSYCTLRASAHCEREQLGNLNRSLQVIVAGN